MGAKLVSPRIREQCTLQDGRGSRARAARRPAAAPGAAGSKQGGPLIDAWRPLFPECRKGPT